MGDPSHPTMRTSTCFIAVASFIVIASYSEAESLISVEDTIVPEVSELVERPWWIAKETKKTPASQEAKETHQDKATKWWQPKLMEVKETKKTPASQEVKETHQEKATKWWQPKLMEGPLPNQPLSEEHLSPAGKNKGKKKATKKAKKTKKKPKKTANKKAKEAKKKAKKVKKAKKA